MDNGVQHGAQLKPYRDSHFDSATVEKTQSPLLPKDDESTSTPLSKRPRRYILLIALLISFFCTYTHFAMCANTHDVMTAAEAVTDLPMDAGADVDSSSHHHSKDRIHIRTLPSTLLPESGHHHALKRLIIVGDVHGMKQSLLDLLEKVKFDEKHDHLILAGDMISKGPDSPGVVDLAMKLGASAVRGNHEDRILLARRSMQHKELTENEGSIVEEVDNEVESKSGKGGEKRDQDLAKELSSKQVAWLESCPVILRVGEVKGMGEVIVVHAGLVPGLGLEKQDQTSVMNMRTMDEKHMIPSDSRTGTSWTKSWNEYQKHVPAHKRTTVMYGHDSKRGLMLEKYSKGIDTGCLKGGHLTAFIIEGGRSEAKSHIVQLKCKDGRPES